MDAIFVLNKFFLAIKITGHTSCLGKNMYYQYKICSSIVIMHYHV